MKLTELLFELEFSYKINDDNTLSLKDLLQVNLGDIESEKYEINKDLALNLVDRLDNYLYDYFLNGYIDTLRHECHEDVKGSDFESIFKLMKKYPDKFDGCFDFMDCIITPELFDISDILENKEITSKCPRCGERLKKSTIKDYTYSCDFCDEDFYSFEVI